MEYSTSAGSGHFTFHNVSINTGFQQCVLRCLSSLHSTMFLLIRGNDYGNRVRNSPLHSTMFLLIRGDEAPWMWKNTFTFHNVSINTTSPFCICRNKMTLHSTMFLLILAAKENKNFKAFVFTFHNVSINTTAWFDCVMEFLTLHSIMFLLILRQHCLRMRCGSTLHSTMFLLIPEAPQMH